jgi:membrane associated rhomboid family serine protease/DNA-directed RNA polymerase subunit RPC12/RpoP
MFFLIPWRVDVPQDRWPVMNWLILLVLVAVFVLQVADVIEYTAQQDTQTRDSPPPTPRARTPAKSSAQPPSPQRQEPPGITGELMLRGWSLKRLLGYMWLHGGVPHLLGNMLFLWIFGNAVCAKIGNLRYLLLYVLLGVTAGIVHLMVSRGSVVGASGAINGVVGMYLVLFYQNEITCVFAFWLILPYVRVFTVSSIWMILLWFSWNVVGAFFPGSSHVAYFAHLGGFAAGFGIALLMCHKGWITMEKYEKSLLQLWQERRRGKESEPLDTAYARLGLHLTEEERETPAVRVAEGDGIATRGTATRPATSDVGRPRKRAAPPHDDRTPLPPDFEALPPSPDQPEPAPPHVGTEGVIRTACACGHVIRVTRQYAGRTVRCSRCRHPVVIPARTEFFGPAPALPPVAAGRPKQAKDKHIRFVCTCGKRMKVPLEYAGRSAKCPQCGARLKIPDLSA